jgi:spermidine synthase
MDSTAFATRRAVLLGVACLGVSAFVTQMVTVRELLSLFSGNELLLGLTLGNWLLLTGLGGVLGRSAGRIRDPIRALLLAQVGIALLPAAQIAGIRMTKQLLPVGLMVGIGEAFCASFVLLLPYCLLSGFLLAVFSGLASARRDWRQIGDVYVLDALGGIIGGLLFALCLVHFFAPFEIAGFLLTLNLLAAAWLAHVSGRRAMRGSVVAILGASLLLFWQTDLERRTAQAMFPGLDVVHEESTPYGNVAVTRQGTQFTVYENGVPIGATEDAAAAEEVVHYALVQHPEPRDVLLVGGGLVGAEHEVEKYPVARIDYVELDPAVLRIAAAVAGMGSDARVHAIAADARRYVRTVHGAYDAILMAVPDPSSAQLNRFYTVEFFTEVRRALRAGGVFSLSLSGAENYATPEMRLLAAAVYRSLASVFPNVLVIPGVRQYFVASERPLGYDIAARLESRHIVTRYVRREYLAATLTADRLAAARTMVTHRAATNHDFRPLSYYVYLRYWLSQLGGGLLLPMCFVAALLALVGGLLAGSAPRAVPAALCASGFAGMGLEVVLLLAFQVIYGYVYQQIGLIVTGFMAGAAVGAAWSGRARVGAASLLFRLDALLSAAGFLLIPLLQSLSATDSAFVQAVAPPVIFPLLNGVIGFLVGAQFPPAARVMFRTVSDGSVSDGSVSDGTVEETAGSLYAFDLLGACLGALVVSTFCVPLMGISATCALLGGVKLLSAAMLRRSAVAIDVPSPRPVPARGVVFAFAFALLVLAGVGTVIVAEETSGGVYAVSFAPAYYWALVALLALGIIRAVGLEGGPVGGPRRWPSPGRIRAALRRFGRTIYASTKVSVWRWAYFLSFSLAVAYPIFRCYFSVPYLFCHVCPRKCIFGFLRPYLVPAAVIMNLERRFWCYQACPIGTLSDCQARACKGSRRVPARLRAVSFAVLGFTAVAYFKIMWDLDHQPAVAFDWYTFFYNNLFAVSTAVIGVAVALVVLGYRLRRSFCEILCPVGAFSDVLLRGERCVQGAGAAAPAEATEPAR